MIACYLVTAIIYCDLHYRSYQTMLRIPLGKRNPFIKKQQTMDLKTATLLLALAAYSCTTTKTGHLTSTEFFSQYSSLAEALRYYPSLMISGTGPNTKVMLRKNASIVNQQPLFVINGMPLGNQYHQASQIINMSDVTSIKIIDSTGESMAYGALASAGIIEIKTRLN